MADLTIPQTNYAQKLKPYDGVIPSYIRQWDDASKAAGLTNRKLLDPCKYGPSIVVVYSGTKEQIEKSGLIDDLRFQRWPSGTKVPARGVLTKRSPGGHGKCSIFKIAEQCYALQITEQIPDAISVVCSGVERIDFDTGTDDEKNVYVGSKEKLINLRIAAVEMFPDDSTEEVRLRNGYTNRQQVGGYTYTLEETDRLYGDKWAYTKYPQKIKIHSEGNRTGYSSPEQWLEKLEDILTAVIRSLLSDKECTTETKSGFRYSVDPAQRAEILNDMEVAAQKIRSLTVKVARLNSGAPSLEAINR